MELAQVDTFICAMTLSFVPSSPSPLNFAFKKLLDFNSSPHSWFFLSFKTIELSMVWEQEWIQELEIRIIM